MIRFITNSQGSGDWLIIELNGKRYYEGHSLRLDIVAQLLRDIGQPVELRQDLDDEQIQEWTNEY